MKNHYWLRLLRRESFTIAVLAIAQFAARKACAQDSVMMRRAEAAAEAQYFAWYLGAMGEVSGSLDSQTVGVFHATRLGQYGRLEAWEISALGATEPLAPFTVGFVNGNMYRLAHFPAPELASAWRAILPPQSIALEHVGDSLLGAAARQLARLATSGGIVSELAETCPSPPRAAPCDFQHVEDGWEATHPDTIVRGAAHAVVRVSIVAQASSVIGAYSRRVTYLFVIDSSAELSAWVSSVGKPRR